MKRIILGFALAPLASGLLQGIIMGTFGAVIFAWVFAYPISLVLGIPAFILFRKKSWLKMWQVTLAGTILGIVGGVLFGLLVGFEGYSVQSVFKGLVLFGLHGLVVSLTFWFVTLLRSSSNNQLNQDAPKSGAPVS